MDLEGAYKLGVAYDNFVWWLRGVFEGVKFTIFGGYYQRVAAQGHDMYMVSDEHRRRALKNGLEFARRISDGDIDRFTTEAAKLPWEIRIRLVRDELLGRPVTTYMPGSRWIQGRE